MQVESEYIVPYPKINNLWDRVAFEARLMFNLVSTRGPTVHGTSKYLDSVVSVARHICLKADHLSPQALSELQEGVEEAEKLLDRYNNPQQSTTGENDALLRSNTE